MKYPKLVLFKFDSCPFCQNVFNVIDQLGLEVEYRDIRNNEEYLHELTEKTNRRTVPCLFIDGEPKFESEDIIHWLETNQNQLEKTQGQPFGN